MHTSFSTHYYQILNSPNLIDFTWKEKFKTEKNKKNPRGYPSYGFCD